MLRSLLCSSLLLLPLPLFAQGAPQTIPTNEEEEAVIVSPDEYCAHLGGIELTFCNAERDLLLAGEHLPTCGPGEKQTTLGWHYCRLKDSFSQWKKGMLRGSIGDPSLSRRMRTKERNAILDIGKAQEDVHEEIGDTPPTESGAIAGSQETERQTCEALRGEERKLCKIERDLQRTGTPLPSCVPGVFQSFPQQIYCNSFQALERERQAVAPESTRIARRAKQSLGQVWKQRGTTHTRFKNAQAAEEGLSQWRERQRETHSLRPDVNQALLDRVKAHEVREEIKAENIRKFQEELIGEKPEYLSIPEKRIIRNTQDTVRYRSRLRQSTTPRPSYLKQPGE